jgi:predicted glutamine amidotransferase
MCGIFGMVSKRTKPFNKRAFCTMGVRNDTRGGDSCGVFIDGLVEYGVDKQKTFMNFFRDSILLETTNECKIALGHCRKASVGKVSLETAQPVVLYNEEGAIDYVLIHNGTIYNYKELAQKYIPDIDIEGLTDSQVMARIFYHKGYDALDEYYGGAVFVIHDYRVDQTLVFKGASSKTNYTKVIEEERPLYYCWHNGRFVFSSIFETLYAFYYEETVYEFPINKLLVVRSDKLKLVKEYNRDKVSQAKPIDTSKPSGVVTTLYGGSYYLSDKEYVSYKIKYNGFQYLDDKDEAIHGVFQVASFGYLYPNKTRVEHWLTEVAFYQGRLLKHPKMFGLIEKAVKESEEKSSEITIGDIEALVDMCDFNPYTEDFEQYYWYDGDTLMVPQGEWKWPMADYSITFNNQGIVQLIGKSSYIGWPTDYNMYTYDEATVLSNWRKICAGE